MLIVFNGADHRAEDPELIEVHVHASGSEVVTVRRAGSLHLEAAREQIETVGPEEEVIVRVLSALARSIGELVDAITAEVDRLEEDSFERDMLAADAELLETLPGLEHAQARHRSATCTTTWCSR